MAHATPQVQEAILMRPGHRDDPIPVGSASWFAWLEQATTFAFADASGRYTARKERVGRAGWYWKAYRMEGGKLRRAYLGKSAELTLERLHAAAQSLRGASAGTGSIFQARGSDASGAQLVARPADARSELLTTKLASPPTRFGLVVRQHLVERLDGALQRKLTLLLAPAGYGKTTLLASWLRQLELSIENEELGNGAQTQHSQCSILNSSVKVAWLSLDVDNNDPVCFWRYVAAALDRALGSVDASIASTALVALHAPEPPPITSILTNVLNALSAQPAEFILVLDDYHTIVDPAIHQALGFLIERLPRQVHLVIATRSSPPLPLGRLRVCGELAELQADDLRFRAEETALFLLQMHGLPLSPENVDALQERTEGWIAGLQIAALAMRGHSDLAGFINGFKGNHRFVAEYLTSEVLDRLPPCLQRFIEQTAVLNPICASLCDAVLRIETCERANVHTLNSDSSQSSQFRTILAELEHSNLFMVPLDSEHAWYRYHQLFREVAHDRLRTRMSSTDLAELHLRASIWYEQHDMIPEAIQHAIGARDWERATILIERNGLAQIQNGSAPLVRGWLEALPASLLSTRPTLCLYHATQLIREGQLAAAEAALRDTERSVSASTSEDQALSILARVALARAAIARATGDLAHCIALSQRVMPLMLQFTTDIQAEATLNLARAYQLNGDAGPAAEQLAEQAIASMRTSGSMAGLLASIVNLARLHMVQGRLDLALTNYTQVPQLVGWQGLGESLGYYAGLADLLCEHNSLEGAAELLDRGLPLSQAGSLLDANAIAHYYLAQARLQQAIGSRSGALAALDTLAHLARQQRFVPLIAERCAALRARLHLMQGDLRSAARWADTSNLHVGDAVPFPREELYLTLARVRVAQSRGETPSRPLQTVLNLLDQLLVAAEAGCRVGSVIDILIIRALALQVQDNRTGALVALARALVLAAPEGYVRSFVDEGAPMLELLREAYARGIALDYVERLLAAFGIVRMENAELRNAVPQTSQLSMLNAQFEVLTARELEVLQLIAEGASNAEIARRLTLSLGTIKRYANNIFSKLNVQSRTQAVAQARKLRLV
jgi:LuxR family maltose regulon positive regulatory protein